MKSVHIFTDGGSFGNPGPGGYGVVMKYRRHTKELSGAFARTTNNRMEIMAAIKGLQELTERCKVTLYSDSQYLVNAFSKGWVFNWEKRNWTKSNREKVKNIDLWKILLSLCSRHEVEFSWVKGHAGHKENERCDYLCKQAAEKPDLPADEGYLEN